MAETKTESFPFVNKGLNLKKDIGTLEVGEWSELSNMISVQENSLTVRNGAQRLSGAGSFAGQSIIHSITKMRVSASTDARYFGASGSIYRTTQALPASGAGLTGTVVANNAAPAVAYPLQRFSGVTFNVGQSGTPYQYFACPSKMLKDTGSLNSGDGLADGTIIQKWGIVPPTRPVVATLDKITVLPATDVVVAAGGANNRVSTTINGVPTGPAGGGAGYYLCPVAAVAGIMVGSLLNVNAGTFVIVDNTTTTSFSAYFATAPVNGNTVTSSEQNGALSASPTVTKFDYATAVPGAEFDGVAPDYTTADVVHIAIGISEPTKFTDIRLRVMVGSAFSTTGADYYEKSLAISSIQSAASLSQTAVTTLTNVVPQAQTGIFGDFSTVDGLTEDLKPVVLDPVSPNQAAGTPFYTELDIPKNDFVAVGQAGTANFTWKNVQGFQVIAIASVTSSMPTIWISSIYIAGGFGPNAFNKSTNVPISPYSWLYTFRNPMTGAESNPCAPMIVENRLSPGRQRVALTLGGTADSQVSTSTKAPSIAIYRAGGVFADNLYRFVDYATNPGAGSLVIFTDNSSDQSIIGNNILEFDNDAPVTSQLQIPLSLTFQGFVSGGGAGALAQINVNVDSGPNNISNVTPGTIVMVAPGTPKQEEALVISVDAVLTFTLFFQYDHSDFSSPNAGHNFLIDSIANMPCPIATQAFDSVFVAGDTNNPHICYKSKTGRPESFPIIELATGISNTQIIGSPSNPIVNMTEYGGGILSLNLKNIYFMAVAFGIMEVPIETPATRGLLSRNAWCKVDNEIWYLSYDGIYSWSGGQSVKRSEAVDPLFRGIAVGPYFAIDMRQNIGNHGTDVITMAYRNNTVYVEYVDTVGNYNRLRFDMVYQRWSIEYHYDQLEPPATTVGITAQYAEQDTGNLIVAKSIDTGGTISYVYLDDVGASDGWLNTPTDGRSIPYSFTTAAYALGAPSLNKQFLDLMLELNNDSVASLFWQAYYDYSATPDPTDGGSLLVPSPSVGRHRVPVSLQGGLGKEAYAMTLNFSGVARTPLFFYSLTFNYIPLTQIQTGRTGDWDSLGYEYDKRLYQLIVTYDIPVGQTVTLNLDTITGIAGSQAENQAVQTFTLKPPSTGATGAPTRLTANFSLTDKMIVKMVRLRPTPTNPTYSSNPLVFKYFSYTFGEFEKLPPDIVPFTPWSDYGSPYDKYAQQIDLEVDTGGIAGTVSLFADGSVSAAAGPFTVTTTSEDRKRNITVPPQIIGKNFRLVNTAGTNGKFQLYKHDIIMLPADRGPVTHSFDWDFLEWPYDKKLKHLTVEYNTENAPTTILMDTMTGVKGGTINPAAQSFVLDQVGRALQTFALPDGIYVKQVRLYPQANNTVFKEWKPTWDKDNYPADIFLFTDWTDLGWPCEKILRSLELEMDTGGVAATVQVQGDGANLGPPITITTTATDRRRILTLPSDLIAKNIRLVFTPGANGKTQYFTHSFEFLREPCAVTHYDTYEFSFGYDGFSFIKQMWLTYTCAAPLTLTFYSDNGNLFDTAVLPAHAQRDVERIYFPAMQYTGGVPILNKSKRHRIQVDSTSQPFKLYADASKIEWMACAAEQRAAYQQWMFSQFIQIPTGAAAA